MKDLEHTRGSLEYVLRWERAKERKRLKRMEREAKKQEQENEREAKKRTRRALKEKIIESEGPDYGSSLRPGRLLVGKPTTKPNLDQIEKLQH